MKSSTDLVRRLSPILGERVIRVTALDGATSSDLFLVETNTRQTVLRVFKPERWDSTTESLTHREALILRTLSQTDLPVPTLAGTLPGNGVLMSYLPGAVELPAKPNGDWLQELAARLVEIHRSSVSVKYPYESWNDVRGQAPPVWWTDASLWDTAQTVASVQPDFDPVFIHRDYHPVNVLWEDGAICGIVDWINACMGPAGVDVAHCRLNLALMYGASVADQFLSAYQTDNPQYHHDPYWDLDDALGVLPDIEPYPPWETFGLSGLTTETLRTRLQSYVRQCVSSRPVK